MLSSARDARLYSFRTNGRPDGLDDVSLSAGTLVSLNKSSLNQLQLGVIAASMELLQWVDPLFL